MKTLIVALNAKYIHSSLAPWYLKAACGNECGDIKVTEFTINDSPEAVLASIYREKPDIAAFSCYIWNISHILRLTQNLKKVLPGIKIVLGGPEVSFDPIELVSGHPWVDYVIAGEGEETFRLLMKYLFDSRAEAGEIDGLTSKNGEAVVSNPTRKLIENLDTIPSPYTEEMLASVAGKIIYFEASRGCPFSCSYCISSTFEGVRHFSLDRVRRDLAAIIKRGVKQVKFVDRTFNCNKARAREIFQFAMENGGETNFHFEAAADLFDEEMLELVSKAPAGLMQFEIGIQTVNSRTLEMINRKTSLDRVFHNVERLRSAGNVHVHLDLIAGLPGEDYDSFKDSFDRVYRMKPHQLQLGFLKLLKGSRIRREAEQHGYEFREYPPYEVLSNRYMAFDQLLELKGIEELVERYYNSGRFVSALDFIIGAFFGSPFEFYRRFYLFNLKAGYLERPLSSRELYRVLLEFLAASAPGEQMGLLNNLLKLDYLASDNSGNLPEGIERAVPPNFKESCFEFLKDNGNVKCYLPGFEGMPAKQIFKQVHFEVFDFNVTQADGFKREKTVVLFNYSSRNRVTGLYAYKKIEDFKLIP